MVVFRFFLVCFCLVILCFLRLVFVFFCLRLVLFVLRLVEFMLAGGSNYATETRDNQLKAQLSLISWLYPIRFCAFL